VPTGDVGGAQLVDGQSTARDEMALGRCVADLGERCAGLSLGRISASSLLPAPGLRVDAGVDGDLVSDNGFTCVAVGNLDLLDLRRKLLAVHFGFFSLLGTK
jgi:hypothetical protein